MFSTKDLIPKSGALKKTQKEQIFRNADKKNSLLEQKRHNERKDLQLTFSRKADLKHVFSKENRSVEVPLLFNMPRRNLVSSFAATDSFTKPAKRNSSENAHSSFNDLNMTEDDWNEDDWDGDEDDLSRENLQTSVKKNSTVLALTQSGNAKDFHRKFRDRLNQPKLSLAAAEDIGNEHCYFNNKKSFVDLQKMMQQSMKKGDFLKPQEAQNTKDCKNKYLVQSYEQNPLLPLQTDYVEEYENKLNERGRVQNSVFGRNVNLRYPKVLNMPPTNEFSSFERNQSRFETKEVSEASGDINKSSDQEIVRDMMAQLKSKLKIKSFADALNNNKPSYPEENESPFDELQNTGAKERNQTEIDDLVDKINSYSKATKILETTSPEVKKCSAQNSNSKQSSNSAMENKIDELLANLAEYSSKSRKKVDEINAFINQTKQNLEETMGEHIKNRETLLNNLKKRFSGKLQDISETCKKLEQNEYSEK